MKIRKTDTSTATRPDLPPAEAPLETPAPDSSFLCTRPTKTGSKRAGVFRVTADKILKYVGMNYNHYHIFVLCHLYHHCHYHYRHHNSHYRYHLFEKRTLPNSKKKVREVNFKYMKRKTSLQIKYVYNKQTNKKTYTSK